ncbi:MULTISPECIES: hypothetical protein [unclassified Crossiella]|uniref:DUF7715 family protein n=1 Tax=unclassified Crossiella TaxID=2620835 RepID=UPI001FFF6982|nr:MULTISPECIES: hypothetical protein [unclassified Crossiella]MCK2240066.1 hypothetical protein [Crossiella sp. S99.2]MCK2252774.1 hypothetical protein [Crossiella sp. S99.1]
MPYMNVLVATRATHGTRHNDFAHAHEAELVCLPAMCDLDQQDPDSSCGCGRAFLGLDSRRSTTTAMIVTLELTFDEYHDNVHRGLLAAGIGRQDDRATLLARTTAIAEDLAERAASHPVGTVLERRGTTVNVRRQPTLNFPMSPKGTAFADSDSRQDNAFVYIYLYGRGEGKWFPAWVDPTARWNGWVLPAFTREAAEHVVDWTNKLHSEEPDEFCSASWDGVDVLLTSPEANEDADPECYVPDRHGRYDFAAGHWRWQAKECGTCEAQAYPDPADRVLVLPHNDACPTRPIP